MKKVKFIFALLILFFLIPSALVHSSEKKMKDKDKIAKLFKNARSGETIRLASSYKLSGVIELPTANDVTIDGRGTVITGSARFVSNGGVGLHWIGGEFQGNGEKTIGFSLFKVTHSTFSNITFNECIAFGNHGFDLLGSSHITISNLQVIGYGNTKDIDGKSYHDFYSEFVQLDQATISGATTNQYSSLGKYFLNRSYFDAAPSHNIIVKNSTFTGTNHSYAQSPMGTHAYASGGQIYNIVFKDNEVKNPVPMDTKFAMNYAAPLHFPSVSGVTIENNRFYSKEKMNAWIRFENDQTGANRLSYADNQPTKNVKIRGNEVSGAVLTKGMVQLVSNEKGKHYAFENFTLENNRIFVGKDGKQSKLVKSETPKGQVSLTEFSNFIGTKAAYERLLKVQKGMENIKDTQKKLEVQIGEEMPILEIK